MEAIKGWFTSLDACCLSFSSRPCHMCFDFPPTPLQLRLGQCTPRPSHRCIALKSLVSPREKKTIQKHMAVLRQSRYSGGDVRSWCPPTHTLLSGTQTPSSLHESTRLWCFVCFVFFFIESPEGFQDHSSIKPGYFLVLGGPSIVWAWG